MRRYEPRTKAHERNTTALIHLTLMARKLRALFKIFIARYDAIFDIKVRLSESRL